MGLTKWLKVKVLRRQIGGILEPVDTESERQRFMDNAVKQGMNNKLAWVFAAVGGAVIEAVKQVADGGDIGLVFTEPKRVALMLISAIMIGLAHRLTAPNTVAMPNDATAKQIGAAVEKVLELPTGVHPNSLTPEQVSDVVVKAIKE